MTLNLDEMIKVLKDARALAASLCRDINAKEYKVHATGLVEDLRQVEEQLVMLKDMFYTTLPDYED
jgi:flagellar biosynthesis regulator FlaF